MIPRKPRDFDVWWEHYVKNNPSPDRPYHYKSLARDAFNAWRIPMTPKVEYVVYGGENFEDFCASTDTEADARHYMFVYGQDGPVKLVKATTYEEVLDQTN